MDLQTQPKTKFLVLFFFFYLLLSYPLLSLLWRRSYPLVTVEVGALFLLLALVSILLAYFLGRVRTWIASVLSALFVTISFMLQFNFLSLGVILCTVFAIVVALRFRAGFQVYAIPILVALIIGSYFDSGEDSGYVTPDQKQISENSELPPIVHILLDGFIGIDGLPEYPASELLTEELNGFFDQFGFQVFPRAYSRYASTGFSLYSALNFKNSGENDFALEVLGRQKHVVKSNALFDAMEKDGYRFNIYQTEYLNFCQSNQGSLDRCWEYPQPNVQTIRSAPGTSTKLKMLLKVLVNQSTLLSDLVVSNVWFLDQGIANHDPRVFSNLEKDILAKPDGKYFFAHVLLPHGPFAFMHDCSVNYESPIWARYATVIDEPVLDDDVYEIRTMKYFEQIDCALNSMRQVFERMKDAGIYENSIIVLHGDHGSSIGKFSSDDKNLDLLTPAEYRSHYSTLFAIKFPGKDLPVDNRILPLSTLLEEFTRAVGNHILGEQTSTFMHSLPESPDKNKPFIFLHGSQLHRVDINIFEDDA